MRKIMHTGKGFRRSVIVEHHLFMEEDGIHSKDKEIFSSFVGMSNDNICTIYLWVLFQIVGLWCWFIYIIHCWNTIATLLACNNFKGKLMYFGLEIKP